MLKSVQTKEVYVFMNVLTKGMLNMCPLPHQNPSDISRFLVQLAANIANITIFVKSLDIGLNIGLIVREMMNRKCEKLQVSSSLVFIPWTEAEMLIKAIIGSSSISLLFFSTSTVWISIFHSMHGLIIYLQWMITLAIIKSRLLSMATTSVQEWWSDIWTVNRFVNFWFRQYRIITSSNISFRNSVFVFSYLFTFPIPD